MNKLKGIIVGIQSSEQMSLIKINVGSDEFSSIILEGKRGALNYKIKDSVTLIFKETEVGIAKNLTGMISFRNRFPATIKKIEKQELLSKIILDYQDCLIESIISTQSTEALNLKEGDQVEWLVKTNEVTLMKNST